MPATLNFPPVATVGHGWNTLPLGAGGLVTGMYTANDGSMVCRTDVGNIYRWSGLSTDYADPTKKWLPLLTYASLAGKGPAGGDPVIGPNNPGGWEHVLSPASSSVHVAIFPDMQGTYQTWLWYSSNSGATWNKSNLSFASGSAQSNDSGFAKFPYYKIAVDPANASVAYCGMPVGSGNTAGAYTSLNQAGGSTLATWTSVKTSGATPIGAVTDTMSCGLAIDASGNGGTLSPPTVSVGGQTVTRRIIIPVGGVGIYESVNGGVTFTEIAVTAFGTSSFYVTHGGFNAKGVYYCVVVSATAWGVWRYASSTWTNIKPSGTSVGDYVIGSFVIIDPRVGSTSEAYLSYVNANHGIGIGYTSTNANTGTPTWTGSSGGNTAYLRAASYDIGYLNVIFGQSANAESPYSTAANIDANGVCFWAGNQSLWYFGTSQVNPAPAAALPSYPNSGLFTSYSWSMGRGQEATVSQEAMCPPGGTYPVFAVQDLGAPMRGTFTTFPQTMFVQYHEYTNESLEYAASDPGFIVTRTTDQGGAFADVSCYSPNYGADGSWVQITGYPTSLWQARVTGSISGTTLTVTAFASGTVILPMTFISDNALGTGAYYGHVLAYGTAGTTGTGGLGTYSLDVSSTVASTPNLFVVAAIQGGQTVAVDHDKWVTVAAGYGAHCIPAYTTSATTTATWALTNLPEGFWMQRTWVFGTTSKPFAVGYGADLGTVWACLFPDGRAGGGGGTTAKLYRSTNSGATFSLINSWSISASCEGVYCLAVPGFPNELWISGAWTGGSPVGLWHVTNANSASPTITSITLPFTFAPIPRALTIGAPATPGGYPSLYYIGYTGYGQPQYLFEGQYPGSGTVVTWSFFGPTGSQKDLPASCQLCGIQSIRGDMNAYQRLYVSSNQSGFAYYNP